MSEQSDNFTPPGTDEQLGADETPDEIEDAQDPTEGDESERLDDAESRLTELEAQVEQLGDAIPAEPVEPFLFSRMTAFTSGTGAAWTPQITSGTVLVDQLSPIRFASAATNLSAGFGPPETGFLSVEQVDVDGARFPSIPSGTVDCYLTDLGAGAYDGYLDAAKSIKIFANQTGQPVAAGGTKGLARLVGRVWRFVGPVVNSTIITNVVPSPTVSHATVLLATATGSGNSTFSGVFTGNAAPASVNGSIIVTEFAGNTASDSASVTTGSVFAGGVLNVQFSAQVLGASLTLTVTIAGGRTGTNTNWVLRLTTVVESSTYSTMTAQIIAASGGSSVMQAQHVFSQWEFAYNLAQFTGGGTIVANGSNTNTPFPNWYNSYAASMFPADAAAARITGQAVSTGNGPTLTVAAVGPATAKTSLDSVSSIIFVK